MVAAPTGCSGSASPLTNPLQVSVSTSLGGATTSAVNLSSSNQTLASATSAPMLTPTTFKANFTQVVPPTESVVNGCSYTITVTFTLG